MEKRKQKEQPNILLIMTDQMRGDCLGIADHPDVKTPYLDHLASLGTRYSCFATYRLLPVPVK